MITTEDIKSLREKTGVSIMQCKKALEEAGGDIEKAVVILRKTSKAIASKKADRVFGSGAVASYVHANGAMGTLVELLCETDFVSKNEEFKVLARDIAMHITASNPQFLIASEINESDTAAASAVFEKEAADKPEAMRAQIVDGKLKAYFKEKILTEQNFIKNPEMTIQGLLDAAMQKFGEKIEISRFTRFGVLEG